MAFAATSSTADALGDLKSGAIGTSDLSAEEPSSSSSPPQTAAFSSSLFLSGEEEAELGMGETTATLEAGEASLRPSCLGRLALQDR